MTLPASLNLLLTVGGAVGLLAGVVAVFRTAYMKSTVEVLTQNNNALTERVKLLEAETAAQSARIEVYERENATLRSALGTAVADSVQRLTEELRSGLTRIEARLDTMAGAQPARTTRK
jgi:hypothetical protein